MNKLSKRLTVRANFLRAIREYFFQQGLIEVDTPILSQYGNPEPALLNFVTTYHGPGELYLKNLYMITSPEYHMKRLLAHGVGDCYYLGKVFRDGELSARHNPEYTILEWYRLGFSLSELMDETASLITSLAKQILPIEKFTYKEAFLHYLGFNPFHKKQKELEALLEKKGVRLTFCPQSKDEVLDLLVTHLLEPSFNPDKLTFLYEYPASQASLAQLKKDQEGDWVGLRYEVYWQGLELANGYEELTNSQEQRNRFREENKERGALGLKEVPLDEKLLASLDDVPPCSGVAMGVDRLLMAKYGFKSITKVIPFGLEDA